MADTNLWGVVIGGLIGIAGGVIGHRMQAKEREERLKAEKLDEFMGALFEVKTWVDAIRDAKFFDKPDTAGPSPVSKAYAIATIYFPQLINKVQELNNVAQDHVIWIAQAAMKKITDPDHFADDLPVTYQKFIDKMNEIIGELNILARREFGRRHVRAIG